MKKITLILMIVMALVLTGCTSKKEEKNNSPTNEMALKFKSEYESYNGKENSNGVSYRKVSIPEDNPFIYISAEDLVKKTENGETFAVYFGFSTCPWCRSVLPTLIDVAKDLELKEIYYVDIYDIRDTYTLNSKNKPEKTKEGSEGYNALLEKFKDVLDDYTLTDAKNKTVKIGEKRIYAPTVVSVVDGKAMDMTTGISEKQTDAYMELTKEMLAETKDKFSCVLSCVADSMHVCTAGC